MNQFHTTSTEGAELLDSLHSNLLKYVVLPSEEAATAVTLWIAASHVQSAWQHAPRLAIVSPEKRCGKSRLIDIIYGTCHQPLIAVNISPAALVHSVTDDPPTLLIDEADTIFTKKGSDLHEDLRGILNAGHQRNRPYLRWDIKAREREECPTFAFAALASIGELPETIMDRAVIVKMRRRAPGEKVESYRSRDEEPLRKLGASIGQWLRDHQDELADAEPAMPVEDRAADTWEPLIAVADLAGGHWAADARTACRVLNGETSATVSAGVRLLGDIRTVFGEDDKIFTETLIAELCKLDESPWADWYGKNITPRNLADLLRPYGVGSNKDVKINGVNRKGYYRAGLEDAWTRYLTCDPKATGATAATSQVKPTPAVAGSLFNQLPATETPPLTSTVAEVAEVADGMQKRDTPCTECGMPLDPILIAMGETTHGEVTIECPF